MWVIGMGLVGAMALAQPVAGAAAQDFGQVATPGHPVVMMPPAVVTVAPPEARAHAPIPVNDPARWIGTGDYPPAALAKGESGITDFALNIDAQGRVAACGITASSGSSALDQASCELVARRARFIPAVDMAGVKIAGRYASRIKWVLPAPPPLPQAGTRVVRYVVEADGTRRHCEIAMDGSVWLQRPCPPHSGGNPFLDKDGKPARRRATISVTTKVDDAAE